MADGGPPAKRPRQGRRPEDILPAIEADARESEISHRLRAMLLHVGEPRFEDEGVDVALRRQAVAWGEAMTATPDVALGILFDGVLSLPHLLPLLAALVSATARWLEDVAGRERRHAAAAGGDGDAAGDLAGGRAFLATVLAHTHRYLVTALTRGHPLHTRALVRFLACLAAVGAVPGAHVLSQLTALVDAAAALEERGGVEARQQSRFLRHLTLSGLLWGVNTATVHEGEGGAGSRPGLSSRACAPAAAALLHRLHAQRGAAAAGGSDEAPEDDGIVALSRQRQERLTGWLDVPSAAVTGAGAPLSGAIAAAAAEDDLQQLWRAVRAAWATADLADRWDGYRGRADPSDISTATAVELLQALAVPTLSRPQDDAAVRSLLLLPSQTEDGGAAAAEGDDGGAVGTAVYVPVVLNSRPSGWGVLAYREGWSDEMETVAAELEAQAPLNPSPSCAPRVAPQSAFWVKPAMHLFGPGGGLSATPVVMRALGLADNPCVTALSLWVVRDLCHDIVSTYFPFHAEAAEALATLPMGKLRPPTPAATHNREAQPANRPTHPVPSVPVAVDAVVSQLLWPPACPAPPPFYSLLLIDLIAASALQRDGDVAGCQATAAIGMAGRVLWKWAPALDDALLPRAAAWMAHHASTSTWAWLWAEWAPAASAPPHTAQHRLLRHLMRETVALAGSLRYPLLAAESLPAAIAEGGLLPPTTLSAAVSGWVDGVGRGDDDGEWVDSSRPPPSATRFANALLDRVKAKTEAAPLAAWLREQPVSGHVGYLALAHACLHYSKANLANVTTIVTRYAPLLGPANEVGWRYAGGPAGGRGGGAGAGAVLTASFHVPVHSDTDPLPGEDEVRAHLLLTAVEQVWYRTAAAWTGVVVAVMEAGLVTAAQVARHATQPIVAFTPPGCAQLVPLHGEAHGISRAIARALRLDTWTIIAAVTDRLAAHAHLTGCRVAAAVHGAKVYDDREEELDEPAAAARDAQVRAVAAAALRAAHTAVFDGIGAAAALARTLQFRAGALDAGDDSAFGPAAAEALRVTLSHLRHMLARHALTLRTAAGAAALSDALAASAHLYPRKRRAGGVGGGAGDDDIDLGAGGGSSSGGGGGDGSGGDEVLDLAADAVRAVLAAPVPSLDLPPALLRDADVPVPDHGGL